MLTANNLLIFFRFHFPDDLFEALSLDDLNGDGDSDVQLMLTGQTLIWYYDAASESYVYQPQT